MRAIVRPRSLLALLCMACGVAAASTGAGTRPLVKVNGQTINEVMLQVFAMSKTGQPLARLSPTAHQKLLDTLINTALLAQEGSRLKNTAALKAGRELANMRYLSTLDITHFMQTHRIGAQQIKTEYDRLVAENAVQQYHVLQILLPNMATGERVRALLAQGMPFARAVTLYSRDPRSRLRGGDLGWIWQAAGIPYLATAGEMSQVLRIASDLRVGGISEPFANSSGVHIIELLARKPLPLAAVKAGIRDSLLQQSLIKHTAQLRAAAHITPVTH